MSLTFFVSQHITEGSTENILEVHQQQLVWALLSCVALLVTVEPWFYPHSVSWTINMWFYICFKILTQFSIFYTWSIPCDCNLFYTCKLNLSLGGFGKKINRKLLGVGQAFQMLSSVFSILAEFIFTTFSTVSEYFPTFCTCKEKLKVCKLKVVLIW